MSAPCVTYGFIGLGTMGYPMALNLRKKIPEASKLIVCELDAARRNKFLEEAGSNCEAVETPREVANKADIILTSLPGGKEVKLVFTHSSIGLLSSEAKHKRLFLDTSTIEVKTSLEILELVKKSGHGDFMDVPVSGGPNNTRDGTLTFMMGGSKELYDTAYPVLKTMGKEDKLFHCGEAGAGLATKQINNYLAGVCIVGVSEAMNMGIKYGLDPKKLADIINVSTGRCYNSLEENPVKGVTSTAAAASDFQNPGRFSIELATGVIRMAVELGKQIGAQTVVADTVLDAFQSACADESCKGKDCRVLYQWLASRDA